MLYVFGILAPRGCVVPSLTSVRQLFLGFLQCLCFSSPREQSSSPRVNKRVVLRARPLPRHGLRRSRLDARRLRGGRVSELPYGVEHAQVMEEQGESWAAELLTRYRETLDRYTALD